ncbi:entericidin A/B family lipoprotein [Geomonas subterranea]|uniref:Entericidin A/B family lipoprotein n=1 Tax=Geomonas subterranea TaxID=2847989 RepID=A0ABX8LEQ4_9BACT|nr:MULTISPECIES: entericidin A/B family lipoprotein [Geomonas]QXE90472.1 entericidin A/B family lipoprotein [Geomonas subterranea]QXM11452.1 entericidin A/B family lipoprotein [Geomonas subterranea]
MKRKIAAAVILTTLTCILALAGCHTVKGVGEDMQSGGREIEKSSGR